METEIEKPKTNIVVSRYNRNVDFVYRINEGRCKYYDL